MYRKVILSLNALIFHPFYININKVKTYHLQAICNEKKNIHTKHKFFPSKICAFTKNSVTLHTQLRNTQF